MPSVQPAVVQLSIEFVQGRNLEETCTKSHGHNQTSPGYHASASYRRKDDYSEGEDEPPRPFNIAVVPAHLNGRDVSGWL